MDSMIWWLINQSIIGTGISAMVARCRSRALSSFPCILDNFLVAGEVILKSEVLMSVLRDDVAAEQWMVVSKMMTSNGSMKSWFKSLFLKRWQLQIYEICVGLNFS